MKFDPKASLLEARDRIYPFLSDYLAAQKADPDLKEAAKYAVLSGGKCFRGYLLLTVGSLMDLPDPLCLAMAGAVELVHAYSLVHDDLPCMDNADFRRGKPSLHRIYGEATALLTGNCLLTLAFDLCISQQMRFPPYQKELAQVIKGLCHAIGLSGMMAGQRMDMHGAVSTLNDLFDLEDKKTGCLLSFCFWAPLVLAGRDADNHPYMKLAKALGRAFQIADDLLDMAGDSTLMGKATQQDTQLNKKTLLNFMSPDQARQLGEDLLQAAIIPLTPQENPHGFWDDVAHYVMHRCA